MPTTTLQRKPELGRYTTEAQQSRVLIGKRINGKVAIFDAPLPARSGRISG